MDLNLNIGEALNSIKNVLDSSPLSAVISVDAETETINFYTMTGNDRGTIKHDTESYRANSFDDEFFEKFSKSLRRYREKNPAVQLQKAALVLPDKLFLTDTFKIPVINKRAMANSLNTAINAIYKNSSEIKFNSLQVAQNKQFATYSVVGVKKEILAKLHGACAANQVGVHTVTYEANSAANAAMTLKPKLKNSSFILLDIHENDARFSLVIKGKTLGYYELPFGCNILYKSKLAAEDLLFDHSACELLVLNAKEKARARQLTTIENSANVISAEGENEENEFYDEEVNVESSDAGTKNLDFQTANTNKKSARKLPKFMLRDAPQGREQFVYENFRLFLKWTLDLIGENQSLLSLGNVETVYVNMPLEYNFLYEMINADAEEHKVTFAPLTDGEEPSDIIKKHLDLFGAFYVKQFNKFSNF